MRNMTVGRRGRRAAAGAALALFLAVAGAVPGAGQDKKAQEATAAAPGGVVRVNGTVLDEARYAAALRDAAFLAKADTPEGRRWVADRMIEQELVRQEALARGLGNLPRVVRALERSRRRGLAGEIAGQIARKVIRPSEAEIAKALGPIPQTMAMSVILVTEEELAKKLLQRIRAGEDFGSLAGKFSEVPQGATSGATRKLVTRPGATMYGEAAEKALFALNAGETAVIPTEAGFLIVRVDSRENLAPEEIADARKTAADKLLQKRREQAKEETIAPLRKQYPVKLLLARLADAPNPGPDVDQVEGWRVIEQVPMVRVGDIELTLADIFQDYGVYRAIIAKTNSREKQYKDLREGAVEVALAALEGRRQGIKYPAFFEADLVALRDRLASAELISDVNLAVQPDTLPRESCRAVFEKDLGKYLNEERLTLSQILVRRKETADEVAAQLAVGLDFAQVARERSVDASAKNGGDLGTLSRSELVKQFSEEGATAFLDRGASRPQQTFTVHTTKGYHIVRVRGYSRVGEGTFEEVEAKVRPDCLLQERRAAGEKFIAALRQKADIQIDDAKVLSVKPSEGAPASNLLHGGMDMGGGGKASPHAGGMGTIDGGGPSPHGAGKGHAAPKKR